MKTNIIHHMFPALRISGRMRRRVAATLLSLAAAVLLAGPASAANPMVQMDTSMGSFVIELYPEQAPLTTSNFLYYVTSGKYDGMVFHRVIQDFVVQGGGYSTDFYASPGAGSIPSTGTIPNEAANGLKNLKYTLSMARTSNPHSATSQFFINTSDNPNLDYTDATTSGYGYAVFGAVVSGTQVVDAINLVPTMNETYATLKDVPASAVTVTSARIVGMEDLSALDSRLYYPHAASGDGWETDIGVINGGDAEITGLFQAFNDAGELVSGALYAQIPPNGRKAFALGQTFANADRIGSVVFSATEGTPAGYLKFYQADKYRVGLPAVSDPVSGERYIPHIASTDEWWTGIGLQNPTDQAATATIIFNTDETHTVSLPPFGHTAFTIEQIFGMKRSDIKTGVINSDAAITGLVLFGSRTDATNNSYLSGTLLKNELETDLYIPHVAVDDQWWTGLAVYNPSRGYIDLSLRSFTEDGMSLSTREISMAPGENFVESVVNLQLPIEAKWIQASAVNPATNGDAYVTGFELFGTNDGKQLAGYTVTGLRATAGAFPNIENGGTTGIAFVNTEFNRATVTLTALTDAGETVSTSDFQLNSRERRALPASSFFAGDISAATWIRFSSDRSLSGFQLNGDASGMLLDALPILTFEGDRSGSDGGSDGGGGGDGGDSGGGDSGGSDGGDSGGDSGGG